MKILISGIADGLMSSMEDLTVAPLSDKTPYEFETIVVDPENIGSFMGGQVLTESRRWHKALENWLGPSHKLIVMLRPNHQTAGTSTYAWIPINNFPAQQMQAVGSSHYIGSIVGNNPFISNFLRDNGDRFDVVAHFTNQPEKSEVQPSSVISGSILSSFTWREGSKEIIFIPPITENNLLVKFVNSLENTATKWKIEPIVKLEEKIQEIDGRIAQLRTERGSLEMQLTTKSEKVNEIIEQDNYLRLSIDAFNKTLSTEHPNPQNYFEAVEAINKAFDSQADMRETLGVSKNFVGDVTQRANKFRHIAKDGGTPTPLTLEEITEFSSRVEEIIMKYLKWLYDKD